jgi:mono/diheme cytochrome c family protein
MSNHHESPDRIDYRETPDITEVHAAVDREKPEPSTKVTPIPLWLTTVCFVAAVWAGLYFGIFNGGLSGNVYNEYESSPAVLWPVPQKPGAQGPGAEAAPETLAQQGKAIFATNCQTCHQPNGMGVPGQYPPLAKSEYVNGTEKRVVAIILKGVQGPITVHGATGTFTGNMVPWETALSPKKIAAVASYIRQEWGNTGAEISEAKVIAAKKEFVGQTKQWTEAELQAIPADATLPDAPGAAAPNAPKAAAPAGAAPAAPAAPGAAAPAAPAKPAPAAPPVAGAPAAIAPAATTAPVAAAPPAGPSPELTASIERGKLIYMQTCFACHQPTGLGIPGAFPPLAGTEFTQGEARRMIAMTLKGVNPPLKVKEMTYAVPMPPLPQQFPILADDTKLADVINYVRNSFGNQDHKGVTPAMIEEVRKEFAGHTSPWTEPELKNFPAPAK